MTAATPEPSHVPPNGQGPTGDGPAGCDPIRLAGMLSELSRSVEAEDDTETLLDDLVAAGVAQIPGSMKVRSAWCCSGAKPPESASGDAG